MPNPGHKPGELQEAWDRLQQYGTKAAAARSYDPPMHPNTFSGRIKAYEDRRDADPATRSAMDAIGTNLIPTLYWTKTHRDGSVTHSVASKPAKPEQDAERILEAIREGLADMGPAPHVAAPDAPDGLCTVFPVADLHMGLLTDAEEVGEDWDSKKAALVFQATFGRLVSVTPSAGVAILAQLGDLLHVDDQRNVTPQSGHQLDADTRYFMILRRAVAVMKWGIEELRRKYPLVVYRGVRGNHDLTAHHAVTVALAEYYHATPGVRIIDNAGEFHVEEFGANMLVLHHGDRAKPDRLVQFAAAQWPEIWGRTRHRLALSGHVHHEVRKEVGGMAFESCGTIIPRDVHAYSHAYSARRGLVSITLDKAQGEVSRARVGI